MSKTLSQISVRTKKFSVGSTTSAWGALGPHEIERRDRLQEAAGRKGQFLSVLPKPGGPLSGWNTNGYKESAIANCPPGAELILNADALFVKYASPTEFENTFFMEMKHKWEITGTNGAISYYAAETLDAWNEFPSKIREIDISVVGPGGGLVFDISGTVSKNLANKVNHVKVHNENIQFGSIKIHRPQQPFCSGEGLKKWLTCKVAPKAWTIWNPAGRELFHLVSSTSRQPGEYSIFIEGGSAEAIGEIKRIPMADKAEVSSSSAVVVDSDPSSATATFAPPEAVAENQSLVTSSTVQTQRKSLFMKSNIVDSNQVLGLFFKSTALDANSKILLLSTLMVINYILYSPINYGKNRKNFIVGAIYNLIVGVIVIAMIATVITLVLKQSKSGLLAHEQLDLRSGIEHNEEKEELIHHRSGAKSDSHHDDGDDADADDDDDHHGHGGGGGHH